jgi:hypothetical protein
LYPFSILALFSIAVLIVRVSFFSVGGAPTGCWRKRLSRGWDGASGQNAPAEAALLWGVTLPEICKMSETHQTVTLFILEAEGGGFEAGEQRDGRHGLKQRFRVVAPLQIEEAEGGKVLIL